MLSKLNIVTLMLVALLGQALLLMPVNAQSEQPTPPSVSFTGVRYDADRDMYRVDLVLANHEAVGSLSVTLSNDAGVQVHQSTVPISGPSQTVDLDAAGLVTGRTYQLEAIAFARDGSALVSEQGRPVSAEREFVHAPNPTGLQIEAPLFAIDREANLLTISVQATGGGAIAGYRVIIEDQATNLAVLEHEVGADYGPFFTVMLDGMEDGEYLALVQALDADGALLAAAEDVFVYQQPQPPGFLAKVVSGLREKPLIPIAIILIAVAVSAWLMLRWLWEKHDSGTPVLHEGGLRATDSQELPFHQTSIVSRHRSPAQSTGGRSLADVPRLAVMIEAFPDRHRVGERVPVTRFPFSIGRGDCNLDLSADTSVSRRHAEIRFGQRGLYILDMLSANGTYVNDERIPSQTPILLDPRQHTSIRVGQQTRLVLVKYT